MTIKYPNGQGHYNKQQLQKKKLTKGPAIYANRGMSMEEHISHSNETYRQHNIAIIYKKPTPIQVVKVDYPHRAAAKITEAYYRRASTTDYNGVYKGFYIDFEVKETQNKTSFPLNNFHEHQIEHLVACEKQGGISFVIVSFNSLNRIFVLHIDSLLPWWKGCFKDGRKSIPLSAFEKDAIEINLGVSPRVPYLNAVDQWIKEKI